MTARRAAVTAVAFAAAVAATAGGAAPAHASLLPFAYGTFSRSHVTTPRPCPGTLSTTGCSFSVTAATGFYFDGGGHCSEAGTIPGYATLGCSVTLSVGTTYDSSCSSVGDVSASVTVSSATGTSFSPVVTAVTWKGGNVSFTANQVDASPTARAIHVTGTVLGVCGVPGTSDPKPPPEPLPPLSADSGPWVMSGQFVYVD